MTPETKDFLLAEYAHLRAEILDALHQVPANEKWALTISGVFWGWFALYQCELPHPLMVAWFPAGFVIVLFARWRALEDKYTAFHQYLMQIEQQFDTASLGWEHAIDGKRNWFSCYEWIMWIVLFFGNAGLALWAVYDQC